MAKFSPPPGTADVFPEETPQWRHLENTARRIFSLYGYGELRTPIFEYTEVFQRGIGTETDVVRKEMYTFEDRGGRSLTLRPEGTAGVMRALLNTDVMNGNEKRVFYFGPMFRGERPAAGRRRQFHQIGVENVGCTAPGLDAENIAMQMHFLDELGISGSKLLINTRGVQSDRAPAAALLRQYFGRFAQEMCDDCRQRLDANIWRILDCKNDHCREIVGGAPDYRSVFGSESRAYFDEVCSLLGHAGVDFEIDDRLVRGLDYYVHTVWEVVHPGLGAQDSLSGGGRYELYLPDAGKPVNGVGFAVGMERLLLAREALKIPSPPPDAAPVFLIGMGSEARLFNLRLACRLRRAGITTLVEVQDKSVKAQMRSANRAGAELVVICGDTEIENGVVICKRMSTGDQIEMSADELPGYLAKASSVSFTEH